MWTDRYPLADCPTRIHDREEKKLSFYDNNTGRKNTAADLVGPDCRYQHSITKVARLLDISKGAAIHAYRTAVGNYGGNRMRCGKRDFEKVCEYVEKNRASLALIDPIIRRNKPPAQ